MLAEERELAGLVGGGELLQHQAPEQPGEHQHGQEEVGLGGDPALAIRGEAAAGHDHVHVRMMRHGRAPGVQHRRDGDPGAQVLGVGGDGEHGLGRGLEQQVVDHRLVLVGDVADRRRQREDDVEVGHGQQLGLAAPPSTLSPRRPGTWGSAGCGSCCRRWSCGCSPRSAQRARRGPPCGSSRWRSSPSAGRGSHGRGWPHARRPRGRGRCPRPPELAVPRAPAPQAGGFSVSGLGGGRSRSSGLVTARRTLVATCV